MSTFPETEVPSILPVGNIDRVHRFCEKSLSLRAVGRNSGGKLDYRGAGTDLARVQKGAP